MSRKVTVGAIGLCGLLWQSAQAQGLDGSTGLRPDLQMGLAVCWLAFALAMAHGKYRYNDPLAGRNAIGALSIYVGGLLGALILSGAFSSIFLQILMPALYLSGTYLLVKQLIPYRHDNI